MWSNFSNNEWLSCSLVALQPAHSSPYNLLTRRTYYQQLSTPSVPFAERKGFTTSVIAELEIDWANNLYCDGRVG
jgi:hypothetical protein